MHLSIVFQYLVFYHSAYDLCNDFLIIFYFIRRTIISMENLFELALESAESAGRGAEIGERRLSPFLRRLTFSSASASYGSAEGSVCHTLILDADPLEEESLSEEIASGVAETITSLGCGRGRRVLVVGLGNSSAVVDALGTETVGRLSAGEKGRKYLATVLPSVFGVTGMESAAVVRGVAGEYRPDLILSVDTLSTRRAERLARAVQISDGGIVPGGGVGNRREPITPSALGVPVISLGVSLLAHADRCASLPPSLVVTPKEIDLLVPLFASALARGVERALFE